MPGDEKTIRLDGSMGEGGGQVLRSALTLAIMTGKELLIERIRAGRRKPGLQAQHLTCVQAATEICGAEVEGAELNSQSLRFSPGPVQAGNYHFKVGTAGSTSLVLQTVFLPLAMAAKRSTVVVEGGTHVSWSPSFHYLDLHFIPTLWQMGLDMRLTLQQAGFYPRGGGRVRATIEPNHSALKPVHLKERGRMAQVRGLSVIANLPMRIATAQRSRVINRIGHLYPLNDIRTGELLAPSPGSYLLLLAEFEHSRCLYDALGEKGKPTHQVADEAIAGLETFLATDAAIDQYLADQILMPLAFASGPSSFTTCETTLHLLTNRDVLTAFLPVEISIEGELGQPAFVEVRPRI